MLDGTKTHEDRNIIYNFTLATPYFMVWYITVPTGAISGISACGRNDAEGIPLIETIQLEHPISLDTLRKNFQTKTQKPFHPPQGLMYLTEEMKTFIEKRNPKLKQFYERHPVTQIPESSMQKQEKKKAKDKNRESVS